MASPMATPWKAVKTAEGKEYYFNSVTNATTWQKPDDLKDDIEVRVVAGILQLR